MDRPWSRLDQRGLTVVRVLVSALMLGGIVATLVHAGRPVPQDVGTAAVLRRNGSPELISVLKAGVRSALAAAGMPIPVIINLMVVFDVEPDGSELIAMVWVVDDIRGRRIGTVQQRNRFPDGEPDLGHPTWARRRPSPPPASCSSRAAPLPTRRIPDDV